MREFLEFINTATEDELATLDQITSEQVQALMAARPFETLKDAAKVKEITKKQFNQMQKTYSETAQTETLTETSESEVQTAPEPEQTPAPVKNKVWRIIRAILIVLLLAAAVFAAVYYGIPLFKEKILNPLQNNTAQLSEIATQQAADVQQLSERIAALETRADAVDAALKSQSETLDELQAMQSTLQANLDEQHSQMLDELDQQLTLTRAIELLSRSRLYLSQSNYGLARSDASSARDLLYGLLAVLPSDQVASMKIVIQHVDNALVNLPAYPVMAVYDIDTAWQLLVDGLPNVPQTVLTPAILETQPSAEPEPSLEVTPTPQ